VTRSVIPGGGKRARPRPRATPVLTPGEERRIEALTVAMALAPGVYARNRMFSFFASSAVQRAKSRAATLRGIVKHLGRAGGITLTLEAGQSNSVLRYEIPSVRLSRVVELSPIELATLRLLASRAGATSLPPEDGDRTLIDTTLAGLLIAGAETSTLVRAAQDAATPP